MAKVPWPRSHKQVVLEEGCEPALSSGGQQPHVREEGAKPEVHWLLPWDCPQLLPSRSVAQMAHWWGGGSEGRGGRGGMGI